jgi:hypothetical protein
MRIMYNVRSKNINQRFQNIIFLTVYFLCTLHEEMIVTNEAIINNNTNLLEVAEPSIKRAVSDLRPLILLYPLNLTVYRAFHNILRDYKHL